MKKMKFPAPADMKFKDEDRQQRRSPQEHSATLVFASTDGSEIKIE